MLDTLASAPWIVQACALALLLLGCCFLFFFVPRALGRWLTLRRVLAGLVRSKSSGGEPSALFASKKDLAHLWAEFRDTLFEQTSFYTAGGVEVRAALRSTVPAEQFFNPQVVVDSRVGAEFFKHLPGILTGIGIIGTFVGLLRGLRDFAITDNAQVVRQSLGVLLHGVSEAFLVSASAITLAMIITLVEKVFIAVLYRQTEEVAFLLDGLYKAGAGEEMLSRLVSSSEDSVASTRALKDTLVLDLKEILTQLAEQQAAAQRELIERQITENGLVGERLGQQIADGLRLGLAEPLRTITGALHTATDDRSEAVHALLSDVVANLNQSIRDLFGEQLAGINAMQHRTIEALDSSVTKMGDFSRAMELAGTRATAQMATELGAAINAIETRQGEMAQHLSELVEAMQNSVSTSHAQTHAELQQTLSAMGAVTNDAVTRMNQGAQALLGASNEFAEAGAAVSRVFQQTAGTTDQLVGAAKAMGATTQALESVVTDFRATSAQFGAMLEELNRVIEHARREASLTGDVLSRIEAATKALGNAQLSAEDFMNGVAEVLGQSTQRFQQHVGSSMDEIYRELHVKTTAATSLLRQTIEDLATAVQLVVPNPKLEV